MDALHFLDVAIGFSLSMIVLATLIGTTTAVWLSVARSRINNLSKSLKLVVANLDDTLSDNDLTSLVKSLLRDRMTNSWIRIDFLNIGATEAIGREELVLLLLRKSAANGGVWLKVKDAIQSIAKRAPETLLREIEQEILLQEKEAPSAPSNVWRTNALAEVAPELASRLFAQFDDVMTRSDDNTAYTAKLVSTGLALAFLVVYPVNSFDMISRLMHDKALSAALVEEAKSTPDPARREALVKGAGVYGDVFDATNKRWTEINKNHASLSPGQIQAAMATSLNQPGVWVTWILVGMGAPFWQGMLDKLLGLRSKITAKTENERLQRETKS